MHTFIHTSDLNCIRVTFKTQTKETVLRQIDEDWPLIILINAIDLINSPRCWHRDLAEMVDMEGFVQSKENDDGLLHKLGASVMKLVNLFKMALDQILR
jgi:hypothetical protein